MRILLLLALGGIAGLVHGADYSGGLRWSERVEIGPRLSGSVQAVAVVAGQRVKRGERLLVIDDRAPRARLAETAAAVARLRPEAEEAGRERQRIEELYARGVIANAELDGVRLKAQRADGLLREAEARERQAWLAVEDGVLRAPFDAVVVERHAEVGQTVATGLPLQVLLVLARAGEMAVRFHVPAEKLATLRAGQTVAVEVAGQRHAGRVRALGYEPAVKEGYPVEAVFAVAAPLPVGMAARVMVAD